MRQPTPHIQTPSGTARGFSLLEVLIAVVILGVGLLALATLQASLARNAAESRARTQAVSLAELVIERQRAMQFNQIPSNIEDEEYQAALNDLQAFVGAVDVDLQSQWFAGSGGVMQPVPVGATPANSDAQYKVLTAQVSWRSATDEEQQVAMSSVLSPVTLTFSPTLLQRDLGGSRIAQPTVIMPSPAGPGVIPIAIGDGSETAATNPRPEILGQRNQAQGVGTRYDVLTYNIQELEGVRIQQRVETMAIDCQCELGGGHLPEPFRVAQWPAFWDGFRYRLYLPTSQSGLPPGAAAQSIPVISRQLVQSPVCNECCRDHHVAPEPPANTVQFSREEDASTKYKQVDNTLVPAVPGDIYRQSCRAIRVDGFWRIATDLRQEHLGLIATSDEARSPVPSSTAATAYEGFVVAHLAAMREDDFEGNADPAPEFDARGLNDPDLIDMPRRPPLDTRYLHGRGLYVDYLEQAAIDTMNRQCAAGSPVQCYLRFIPFTTINVTELARWMPIREVLENQTAEEAGANASNVIQVTSNASSTVFGNPLDPKGGVVTANTGATGSALARIGLSRSNTGIAIAIPSRPSDLILTRDYQQFCVGEDCRIEEPPTGESFSVILDESTLTQLTHDNISNDPAVGWRIDTSAADCSKTYADAFDRNPNPYLCRTDSELDVQASVTVADYNLQYDAEDPNADSCTRPNGKTRIIPAGTERPFCTNYVVTSATLQSGGTTTIEAVGNGGKLSAWTRIGLNPVVPDDVLRVDFEARPPSRTAVSSCPNSDQQPVVFGNCD